MSAHPGEGNSLGTYPAHYFSRLIVSHFHYEFGLNFGVLAPRTKLQHKHSGSRAPSQPSAHCCTRALRAGAPVPRVGRLSSVPASQRKAGRLFAPARLEFSSTIKALVKHRHALLLACSLLGCAAEHTTSSPSAA